MDDPDAAGVDPTAVEPALIGVALGATDDPLIGERVRGREPTTLAFALATRSSQRRATFDWFKANEEAFTGRLSNFAHRWLPRLGADFCTTAERDEVEIRSRVIDLRQPVVFFRAWTVW